MESNINFVDDETLQKNAERKQRLKVLLEKGGEISKYSYPISLSFDSSLDHRFWFERKRGDSAKFQSLLD